MRRINKKPGTISASSRNWLERHINDPYVLKARKDGYRSRAAYKLLDIQAKFNLINLGHSVLDLGAAPGSWSQVLAKLAGKKGNVVAVDIAPMQEIEGVNVLQLDARDLKFESSSKFNSILSDMSPNTTGFRSVDHLKSMELCECVLELADELLLDGGSLIMKVLIGGQQDAMLKLLKDGFERVKFYKPMASRRESKEIYLIAIGRKPNRVISLASIENMHT